MQRLVIDTNVFVSALIQRGYPYLITRELFSNNDIQLCVSDEILEEYYDVLNREKFQKFLGFIGKAQLLLANIKRKAIKHYPDVKINLIKDLDDNKFLELSETCKANFLITGNTNDFTFKEYKTTKIVTPKEFWEIYLTF
jgi:uncharacterized protein